jgi:xylulokinase
MATYLGFDASTQSLTATVIEIAGHDRRIVFEHVLEFDAAFPEYGTTHGVLVSGDDGRTVTAPPAMWAAALDRMAAVLAASGLDLSRIRAVTGSAQQHGSVYLATGAAATLRGLDATRPLTEQIGALFSRTVSPVWMDCSTTAECASFTKAMGGDAALARLTGSRAYERFTAAQIRKFASTDPVAYAHTERIHLVSSFMASLLVGRHAPLEPADASGMNLMDLSARRWSPAALDATSPDLGRRLPPIHDAWTVTGEIAPYWRRRYGFGPAIVIPWSGDNPSSLIGLGLIAPGALGISLGTSDTVFGPIAQPAHDPDGAGHVFGSPAGGYMALTCFANGSLARERVRDTYGLDWDGFAAALRNTPAGNGGAMMAPWFVPEITPPVAHAGTRRHNLDGADPSRMVRAVVEAQAMAMRLHSRWIAPRADTVRATGGAAANRDILQVIADVFDAEVVRGAPRNAASLGAALRAYHAERRAEGDPVAWDDVIAGFTGPSAETRVRPDPRHAAVYADLLPAYEAFEARARRGEIGSSA